MNLSQASQMTYYGCPCYHGNVTFFSKDVPGLIVFVLFAYIFFLSFSVNVAFPDLVNRSRPGSRISATNSRNTSRNGSPAPMGPAHRSRVAGDPGNDTRDYAELVDDDGDYSTPSGNMLMQFFVADFK